MADQDTQQSRRESFDRWALFALVMFTVVVRAKVMSAERAPFNSDVDRYKELAEGLVDHGVYGLSGIPTAYRPPLYALLLAPLVLRGHLDPGALAFAHVSCGVVTVWLVTVLGRMWGLGRWRFVAGTFVALDPILLRQSTLLMTETVAAFLAALALAVLTAVAARPVLLRAAAAGVALGLCVLCRPTFLPFAIASPLALWWVLPPGPQRLRCALCAWLAVAATLAPWTLRNAFAFGRPIVTTTHGGMTFLLANNDEFYAHLREAPGEPWDAESFNRQPGLISPNPFPRDELSANEEAYKEAWSSIRAEPGMFLRAVVFRLSRLWGVLPLPLTGESVRDSKLRQAIAAFYIFEFALVLTGLWNLCRRAACAPKNGASIAEAPAWWNSRLLSSSWLFALLLAASFTALHALYWTDLRMRAPLVPAICLVAAAGASAIAERLPRRKPIPK